MTRPARKAPRKVSVPHASLTEADAENLVEVARIAFEVPGPPVPCARARVSIKKRRVGSEEKTFAMAFTPQRTREYERRVGTYALNAVNRCRTWRKTAAAYRVRATFYRDTVRGDLDNTLKALADGMNGIVYADDRQVSDAVVALRTDRERPRTEVEVVMLEVRK